MKARLKGHRPGQLQLLHDAGALSLETAVPVGLGGGFRTLTLSAMIGEGLVKQAYLPFKGDSRRRTSHYWLTSSGRYALAA